MLVREVLVGPVLVVGEVVGEFVVEVVGAVLVGVVLVGAVLVGIKIHSLWREVLEGWKGEEVREGTCS